MDAWLNGRVGLSASDSPDLARLGLLEMHFRVALGEITRAVVLGGGGIMYGGRLDGYTTFVTTEIQRYARRDRPLLICLAWHVHRAMSVAELESFRRELGLYGQLVCLDVSGEPVSPSDDPILVADGDLMRRGLTGLRRYMAGQQIGRVFIGGRRRGFQGKMSGLVEEVLLSLQNGQPTYLAGGFGGATYDMTRVLGVCADDWLPVPADQPPSHPAHMDGLAAISALASGPGFHGLCNGLTAEENRWLATTHRPGEIASLVSLGLQRVFGLSGNR